METLTVVLSPIVWSMRFVFQIYIAWFGSTGLAILALSMTFALLLWPLQRRGNILEKKISNQIEVVHQDVAKIDKSLKGEARFNAVEGVYQKHKYHPIKSVLVGVGFLASLPVLLSAIILFTQSDELVGKSFLYISDLSIPDAYLSIGAIPINITPVLMFVLTLIDAQIRYADNHGTRTRFLLVSIILVFLVYRLPAGLILYWIGSNIMSFSIFYLDKHLNAIK